MPQIFPPRSNTFARLSILGALVVVLALVGAAAWYDHSSAVTGVGVPAPQPVPFPHSLHVAGLGLDCRYCHAGADQSAFADLPPAETCMSCHSQVAVDRASLAPIRDSYASGQPVQWNRVNQLPDHVFFNHEIHVNKGVGCETCHGRVDQMSTDVKAHTFYMSWCLDCHRDPAQYLRPVDQVTTMGYQPAEDQRSLGARLMAEYDVASPQQLTNCSICHR